METKKRKYNQELNHGIEEDDEERMKREFCEEFKKTADFRDLKSLWDCGELLRDCEHPNCYLDDTCINAIINHLIGNHVIETKMLLNGTHSIYDTVDRKNIVGMEKGVPSIGFVTSLALGALKREEIENNMVTAKRLGLREDFGSYFKTGGGIFFLLNGPSLLCGIKNKKGITIHWSIAFLNRSKNGKFKFNHYDSIGINKFLALQVFDMLKNCGLLPKGEENSAFIQREFYVQTDTLCGYYSCYVAKKILDMHPLRSFKKMDMIRQENAKPFHPKIFWIDKRGMGEFRKFMAEIITKEIGKSIRKNKLQKDMVFMLMKDGKDK